jgi:hypothetical protein
VKANTQLSDSEEDLDGTVVYTVKSIGPDGLARVAFTENFSCSRKSRVALASAPTAQDGHASFFEHHSSSEETANITSAPGCIDIDRYGRITGAEGGGNLPFPVGRMAHLAIEPLSPVDENAWTLSGDVGIVLTEKAAAPFPPPADGMFPPPPADNVFPPPPTEHVSSPPADGGEEPLPAHEKTTYTIKDSDDASISVRKTYGFATAEEVDDKPRLAMTGEGELTFDRQNGVFTSSTMKIRVTLREDGSPLELASMVNCALIRVAEEPSKDP